MPRGRLGAVLPRKEPKTLTPRAAEAAHNSTDCDRHNRSRCWCGNPRQLSMDVTAGVMKCASCEAAVSVRNGWIAAIGAEASRGIGCPYCRAISLLERFGWLAYRRGSPEPKYPRRVPTLIKMGPPRQYCAMPQAAKPTAMGPMSSLRSRGHPGGKSSRTTG